ncbi:MAG: hypothetical protein CMB80_04830 [Flammeovirgaceae bacterium]|nr:hypothetical protein [Flammeovirgaceae bacterium]
MSIKSIIILGSGRSGTSFLANLLHGNGVYVGNCTGGTLENMEVRKINESYLTKHHDGQTRSKLPYGILPNDEIKIDDDHREKATEFINQMDTHLNATVGKSTWWDDSDRYWTFKDPRSTLLHDMWVEPCDIVIGVFRNPVEVVKSYMKLLDVYYPGDQREEGFVNMLNYWKRFNQSLVHVFNTTDKPKYLLDFNDNIDKQTSALFSALEIPRTNFNYDERRREQQADFIYDDNEVTDLYDKLCNARNLL